VRTAAVKVCREVLKSFRTRIRDFLDATRVMEFPFQCIVPARSRSSGEWSEMFVPQIGGCRN